MRWETNLGNGITNVQASDLCAFFYAPARRAAPSGV